MEKLILASASPQRKTLLEGLGIEFTVLPSALNEEDIPEYDPVERAKTLARTKAQDVASTHSDCFVIGCDTLVVNPAGELYEKPRDGEHAAQMLSSYSGGKVMVHSALCVVTPDGSHHEGVSSSTVTFKKLTDKDIDWWVSTLLWQGRSGGFQIDGKGQLLISNLEGDFTSVVGLPVYLLGQLLEQAGFDVNA